MHIETVVIDRIDWVSRNSFKHRENRSTNLSFRLRDGTPLAWEIPGWPEIREEMCVTALLARPLSAGRSNRVLGWKSHADGSLAFYPAYGLVAIGTPFSFAAATLFLLSYLNDPDRSSQPLLMFGIAFLLAGVFGLYSFLMRLRVIKVLRSLP